MHPPAERCPDCAVVTAKRPELPPLKPGARRLFVIVPGVLGYGWEWDDAVAKLKAASDADYVVFWWEPWGSLRKAARELRETLTRALYRTRMREVVVVGHSVGGLVVAHALGGLSVPPSRTLTAMTIGAPFAGMMGPPFYDDDALNSPAMISVMGTFRDYPPPPPNVKLFEYVTAWPSDPVMQPRYGHKVAPPEIGPRGAKRIDVDTKFDHNQIVSRIVVETLRLGRPPERIAP